MSRASGVLLAWLLITAGSQAFAQSKPKVTPVTSQDREILAQLEGLKDPDDLLTPEQRDRAELVLQMNLRGLYPEYDKAVSEAKDEFARREVENTLGAQYRERGEAERVALTKKLWSIRLLSDVGEYDFNDKSYKVRPNSRANYIKQIPSGVHLTSYSKKWANAGVLFAENAPFEPGQLFYRLRLNEADARLFREGVSQFYIQGVPLQGVYIELGVRVLRYGGIKLSGSTSMSELQVAVVGHRIHTGEKPLTAWRLRATDPVTQIAAGGGDAVGASQPAPAATAPQVTGSGIKNIHLFLGTLRNRLMAKNYDSIRPMCRLPLGRVVPAGEDVDVIPISEEEFKSDWYPLLEPLSQAYDFAKVSRTLGENQVILDIPNSLSAVRKNKAGTSRYTFEKQDQAGWLLTEIYIEE